MEVKVLHHIIFTYKFPGLGKHTKFVITTETYIDNVNNERREQVQITTTTIIVKPNDTEAD